MLFIELALIRWTGENVVYLSFFTNFVLLGSFLGIGIGFLRAGRGRPIYRWTPTLLAAVVGLTTAFPVSIDRTGDGVIYFGEFTRSGLPVWVVLPLLFVAVAAVMAAIADGTAREFARFEPLTAYRLDIMGAVAGSVAFAALAFLQLPPVVWGLIAAAALFALIGEREMVVVGSLTALLGVLALASVTGSLWSPYYRIDTVEEDTAVHVSVNGIPHQAITTAEHRLASEPVYEEPYLRFRGRAESVLVIGAGNGTDVAIALAEGVRSVDAVEIDPVLLRLGRDLHPNRPYDDDRVDVFVDDGRAFMERTDRRYDLVLYALPDSLILVSGQSNLRLESYLFTVEALQRVRELLTDDGVFAMYNYYREQWLIDRLARMLDEVFGNPPCVQVIGEDVGLAVLMASNDPSAIDCSAPAARVTAEEAAAPVTDDKPFLYLDERRVPTLYVVTVLLVLGASVVGVRATAGPLRGFGSYLDLFLMGTAFLLLETKTVVQFSLLFGSTWLVNALVFAGILLSVLAAIEVARWRRLPDPPVLYGFLFAALALAWISPPGWLLSLGIGARFVTGVAVAFAPVFVANLIFAQRFKDTASSTTAFGINLLGAMVGGVLEYAALWTGYRWLTVVVAIVYLGALVAWRRLERVAVAQPV